MTVQLPNPQYILSTWQLEELLVRNSIRLPFRMNAVPINWTSPHAVLFLIKDLRRIIDKPTFRIWEKISPSHPCAKWRILL